MSRIWVKPPRIWNSEADQQQGHVHRRDDQERERHHRSRRPRAVSSSFAFQRRLRLGLRRRSLQPVRRPVQESGHWRDPRATRWGHGRRRPGRPRSSSRSTSGGPPLGSAWTLEVDGEDGWTADLEHAAPLPRVGEQSSSSARTVATDLPRDRGGSHLQASARERPPVRAEQSGPNSIVTDGTADEPPRALRAGLPRVVVRLRRGEPSAAVAPRDAGVPARGVLRDPPLGREVDVRDAEPLGGSPGPTRSCPSGTMRSSRARRRPRDRRLDRGEVAPHELDPPRVVDLAVGRRARRRWRRRSR